MNEDFKNITMECFNRYTIINDNIVFGLAKQNNPFLSADEHFTPRITIF